MKIAYLSQAALSDVDFSFIKEAQKIMDIYYYILVTPSQRQKAAVNLTKLPLKFNIVNANDVEEMRIFGNIVNLSKIFIVNYTAVNNHQIKSIVESYKLYKEIKNKSYDIVHLTWPANYLDFFIYRLKKKMVLTVHDPFSHSSQAGGIREFERKKAFRKCNHLILLNSAQKEDFIREYGLNKDSKYVYDSNLSCYDYLYVHKKSIKSPNPNQILFFGQIFAHKGIDYLLDSMKIVHDTCPNAKLIVAGSGNYWFDIESYKKLNYIQIENRYIPDAELVSLVSSSAFVVVPYIDATQSGVVMTSYTFNRPCIATNVGGLPEMVKDGYNGILVKPKDSLALAKAIITLIQNPHMIELFSERIAKDYRDGSKSWLAIAKQYKHIYERICDYNKEK